MVASGEQEIDKAFMAEALSLAKIASSKGEVPVGAVVVQDGQIIARAYNIKESSGCPTHHAEILALERASKALGRWRLTDCEIYVTLEPCLMCCGALIQSRIGRLVYGAADPKAGAVTSLYQTLSDARLNHRPQILSGLGAEESAELLKSFFQGRRQANQEAKLTSLGQESL